MKILLELTYGTTYYLAATHKTFPRYSKKTTEKEAQELWTIY